VKNTENLWFAEWFDTDYYHTLYKHRDELEAELFMRSITSHLGLPLGSKICDLACGKGRHAHFLSQLGYNVTGLDLSENSIQLAKDFESSNLRFDVHDMRDVYPSVQFDAIFNLFTSFGYFDAQTDNLKVLQSMKSMLNKKGMLVIDFMNAEKVITNLVAEEVKTVDGLPFHIKRSYDGTHIFKNIQFDDQGKHFDFTERVQALKRADFEGLLSKAGFEVVELLGDYELNPFDAHQSDRLILIAQ
jgi:2-polyprenyl-3-methyl-5-hydroxy-6-metoxy-1,4-benzoquinol methylase